MSIKSTWGRILLSGASIAAMGATPALAQQAQTGTPAATASEEVVVTATGRQAAIQDVPIAVTAIGQQQIQNAGIQDIKDLQNVAPGYKFYTGQSNTAGSNPTIRGLGTGADNPGFEGAVGVFIDGVYRSRAATALGDLPGIERVEVLRGPQGTLFGRNTSAGALNIITQAPEFDTHYWMDATAGNLSLGAAHLGMNTALSDNLAVRVDGSIRGRDGYITDLRSNQDLNTISRWSGRAQALWDINENASLRLIFDGGHSDENCCYAVTLQRGPTGAAINGVMAAVPGGVGILPGKASLGPVGSPQSFTSTALGNPGLRQASVTPGHMPREQVDEWGGSGQLDWTLGGGVDMTAITSYRDWSSKRNQDIDFSDFDRAYRDGLEIGFKTFTQEVRFHGTMGRLDWLVGGFYGHEVMDTTDRIRVGTQAATYLDALAAGSDVSSLGAPDINGASPGSGYQIYNSFPGTNPATPTLFNVLFSALASTQNAAAPANPATGAPNGATLAALFGAAAAPGGFATQLSFADPVNGDGQQHDTWHTKTNSFAVFTHDQFNITDNLVLTLGVRYNRDDKDMTGNILSTFPGCGVVQSNAANTGSVLFYSPNPALPAATQAALGGVVTNVLSLLTLACNPAINTVANGAYSDSHQDTAWTGTASLAYHITPDVMLYGGYSRGYKSGGWNVDRSGFNILPFSTTKPSTADLAFDPEFVDSYEVGLKNTLWGHTYLDINGFYETVKDFQLNAFSGFNFITFNAPRIISRGVEVDLTSHPTANLMLSGGVMYDDAFYDTTVHINPLVASDTILAGTQLAGAAKWTGTGSVTYTLPLGNDLQALFYADGRYTSPYPVQTLSRNPLSDNDAYTIYNARIGIGRQDDRWSFEVWAHNITNQYYNIGAFGVPEQTGTLDVYPSEPRTWGATLRLRY